MRFIFLMIDFESLAEWYFIMLSFVSTKIINLKSP